MENVLIEFVKNIPPHDLTLIAIVALSLRFAQRERKNKEDDE